MAGLDVAGAVRRAIDVRSGLIGDGRTTAYRVLSGDADGLVGVYADVYGEVAVANVYEGTAAMGLGRERVAEGVLRGCEGLGVRGVYTKVIGRDRSGLGGVPGHASDPRPSAGEGCGAEVEVLEDGRRLIVRPFDGLSTGVFVDQRANRRWLVGELGGGSLLNLFAYTGAFGVACAVGGSETSNVDVSDRYLSWAEANYRANGLAVEEHFFPRMDAREFVRMAVRKGMRFGGVVVDPPSFGAANKRKRVPAWNAERELAGLVGEVVELVERGGVCLVVTNNRALAEPGILEREVMGVVGERGRGVGLPEPDVDVRGEVGRTAAVAFRVR